MHDIHSHIIPGIDDGAKNIGESLEICRKAALEGVETIIATPHYIYDSLYIRQINLFDSISLLNKQLLENNIKLTILPGMEVYITPNIVKLLELNKIITLNCKNHILIELPLLYSGMSEFFEDVVFNLQLKSIRPVIAHPERYRAIIAQPNIVYDMIDRGCLIQVDCGSIQGMYGREVQRTAFLLLKHNMVHAVASDTHTTFGRTPSLKKCYDIINKKFGQSTAQFLFIDNPYKIINGEYISIDQPDKIVKKWFWLF